MKKIALAMLAIAVFLMPLVARADFASNPQMRQVRQNLMQLHDQARTAALAALTPAHRTLLTQIVGQLHNDPNARADIPAAAKTLDSALTPTEAQSILRISNDMHARARQLMQNAFA